MNRSSENPSTFIPAIPRLRVLRSTRLNIRSLSSSNVGDTAGVMSYSNGSSNVFIDLSKGGTNAALTDSLNGSGSTSVVVNYMTKSSDGSAVASQATITVGGPNSTYANTAQGLISAINNSGLGLNASFGTATQAGTAAVADALASVDGKGTANDTGIIITAQGIGVGSGTDHTDGAGTVGKLTVNAAGDALSGTLNIVGSNGKTNAITLGTGNSTDNITDLAATINKAGYGVTASVSGSTLTFTSASSAVSVSGSGVTDQTAAATTDASFVFTGATSPAGGAMGSIVVGSTTDLLSGKLNLTSTDGSTITPITLGATGSTDTLSNLANYVNTLNQTAHTGVTASLSSDGKTLSFTAATGGTGTAAIAAGTTAPSAITPAVTAAVSLSDVPTAGATQSSQVGTLTLNGASDTLTNGGTLHIGSQSITIATGVNDTLTTLAAAINKGSYGVTASVGTGANANVLTFSSPNSAMVFTGTSLTDGVHGAVTVSQAANSTSSSYYSIGISGSVNDSTTNSGAVANTGMVADANGGGGVATISYSDATGQSLSATDLSNQADAQGALEALNTAITDVAAQDGYIGAQINTLNAVSSVLSTQSENVTSAQNAVQATDYATASSNMSKYEILSQTGIAALAQANSVQQEVTKLLQ